MSASSDFSELSGQNPGRLLEKSSFSQRCSMLSQYLKANGSFGDLSLGMTCNNDPSGTPEMFRSTTSTMNLFPVPEKSRNMATPRDFGFINFFPPKGGFSSSVPQAETPNVADYSLNKAARAAPERAPMTIFYAGQVLVFNDLPEDKAKEVFHLASQESSGCQTHTTHAPKPVRSSSPFPSPVARSPVELSSSIPSSPNVDPNCGNKVTQESIQPAPRPVVASDLPIARKASLHRFLEKRKDRINAKAPYQANSPTGTSAKPSENMPWLGLAAQSRQ